MNGKCPICYRVIDTVGGVTLAEHSQQMKWPWLPRSTRCPGSDRYPLDSPYGRIEARNEVERIKGWAAQRRQLAQLIRENKPLSELGKHVLGDEPPDTDFERSQYALHLEAQAEAADRAVIARQNLLNQPKGRGHA